MGANDPTTLSTQASLKFGSKVIPAGKFILQAKYVESQKWHLLIQSEGGESVAGVAFSFRGLISRSRYLTITLEKKDNGGRLLLQWGTLALATDFQPAAMTASSADSGKWNELSAFHEVMSATFHPMEKAISNRYAAERKSWRKRQFNGPTQRRPRFMSSLRLRQI